MPIPSLGRTVKGRAGTQAAANIESSQAVVSRVYADAAGNVYAADVTVQGQVKSLTRVTNASGQKLYAGATVEMRYLKGQKHARQITGSSSSSTATALAQGTANAPAPPDMATYLAGSSPVLLQSADTDNSPGGYVQTPGANVYLTDTPPGSGSGGAVNGQRMISVRPLVTTSLPNALTTTLPDGTLLDLVDSYGNPQGMYRLSVRAKAWQRRDAGTTIPSFAPAAPVDPAGISMIVTYSGTLMYLEAVPAFTGADPALSAPFTHWRKSTDGGSTWFGYDNTAGTTFPGHVMQHSLSAGTIRFQVRTENAAGVFSNWYTQTTDTAYAAPPSYEPVLGNPATDGAVLSSTKAGARSWVVIGSYTLPPATASILGGVKIGANVTVAADGTISVAAAPVTTVAGRTGAITLAYADISGLASAATHPATDFDAAGAATAAQQNAINASLQKSSNLSDLGNTGTARTNLGLKSAALVDVPASGNASATQAVLGNDTRLGAGASLSTAAPAAETVAAAAAIGSATTAARADHVHAMPGVFGASGANHAAGFVPDPGATAGTTNFLREDGTWAAPPATSGGSGGGIVAVAALPTPDATTANTLYRLTVATAAAGVLRGTEFDGGAFSATYAGSNAFDGNLSTSYASSATSVAANNYIGLDFGAGSANYITKVRYVPRPSFGYRMANGIIEGSNTSATSGFVTIGTLPSAAPPDGVYQTLTPTDTTNKYRWVRYRSVYVDGSYYYADVAELEFTGGSGNAETIWVSVKTRDGSYAWKQIA